MAFFGGRSAIPGWRSVEESPLSAVASHDYDRQRQTATKIRMQY